MKGYTLLEVVVVVAIIGMAMVVTFPSVSNTLEERALELATREISSSIQTARFLAVTAKARHRVRFWSYQGTYAYTVESETGSTWSRARGWVDKKIPGRLSPALTLPTSLDVIFDGLGLIDNFDGARNTITLRSAKLAGLGQPSRWTIRLYATGSVDLSSST
jgi:prepilin-type N-terminal cleavage/methylation domain-containing protein